METSDKAVMESVLIITGYCEQSLSSKMYTLIPSLGRRALLQNMHLITQNSASLQSKEVREGAIVMKILSVQFYMECTGGSDRE